MNQSEPLRLVVLGSGGVGKSALTVQFVTGSFVEKYDPTIEDSYRKNFQILGFDVLLEILDTAGTESFTSLRDLYMKNGDGFLLLYSIVSPATFRDVNGIRDQIVRVRNSQNFPLVVIGTKLDLQNERLVQRDEGLIKARVWGAGFLETSAKTNIGVYPAFTEIVGRCLAARPAVSARRRKAVCTLI